MYTLEGFKNRKIAPWIEDNEDWGIFKKFAVDSRWSSGRNLEEFKPDFPCEIAYGFDDDGGICWTNTRHWFSEKGSGHYKSVTVDQLSIYGPEIHITVNGNKTIGVLKENGNVVNRKEANCNPVDTFDFETGARLVIDRLFPVVREVKRHAKVGEYVKLIKAYYSFDEVGDILKVERVGNGCVSVIGKNHPRDTGDDNALWNYSDYRYVVLENYQPPKKKVLALISRNTGHDYGIVGDETEIKDINNIPLCLGDTVELFDKNLRSQGHVAVVYSEPQGYFIMSIAQYCSARKNFDELSNRYFIIKRKSYKDLKNGDIIDGLEVIEKEIEEELK